MTKANSKGATKFLEFFFKLTDEEKIEVLAFIVPTVFKEGVALGKLKYVSSEIDITK